MCICKGAMYVKGAVCILAPNVYKNSSIKFYKSSSPSSELSISVFSLHWQGSFATRR